LSNHVTILKGPDTGAPVLFIIANCSLKPPMAQGSAISLVLRSSPEAPKEYEADRKTTASENNTLFNLLFIFNFINISIN
jgi:hypothetical protein